MKQCLADVNVLLALLVRHHEHHTVALNWFHQLSTGEAILCRFVQLGLIRLLGNRSIMGEYVIDALTSWALIQELLMDERMGFAGEPTSLNDELPKLLTYPTPATKLVADAYLAAFSIAAKLRLTTFDKGFQQFRGIDLHLLRATK